VGPPASGLDPEPGTSNAVWSKQKAECAQRLSSETTSAIRRDIENAYLHAIDHAKRDIILANAYFLPGLNVRHALFNAARRGVRIVLLLQGTADHRLMHYASRALYGTFLHTGIDIYEYRKSLMHAKVAVIDVHWSTVGSSNLDPFSLLLSLEANVVVDDETFAKTLNDSLLQAIQSGAQRIGQTHLENATAASATGKLVELRFCAVLDRYRGGMPRGTVR
jgi:phosphatidylserine/phosphatidylglycerophosphate/cardiolipin synthase-like enzyme